MFTTSKTLVFAAFLVLALSVDTASSDCTDSLICCNEFNEILLIVAVLAVCLFFLIQCLVIVCLAWKLNKFHKRLDEYGVRRGSLNYSNYPMATIDGGSEVTETYGVVTPPGPGREKRFSSFPDSTQRASVTAVNGAKTNPIAVTEDDNARKREIWGLY